MTHLRETHEILKKDNAYPILFFSCFLLVNPGFGLDIAILQMFQRFQSLRDWQTILLPPIVYLLVSVFLLVLLKSMKRKLNPKRWLFLSYLLICFTMAQFLVLYKVTNIYLWCLSFVIYDMFVQVVSTLMIIINVQQTSEYCKEGFEGFSINIISGSANIAVIISNTIGQNIFGTYLAESHYSLRSITYTITICAEIAIIFLLLGFLFLRSKGKGDSSIKRSSSPEFHSV